MSQSETNRSKFSSIADLIAAD